MLVLLVFAIQVILYILNKKLEGKIPYSLIWFIVVCTFLFILPQFDQFPIEKYEGDCGMPVMGHYMATFILYYIIGPGLAFFFHFFWMLRVWRKK